MRMNKVILSGGVTKDAELNFLTTGTPKMMFNLAVERSYQKDKNNKKVDFITCELFGKSAENLCQYITKGKQIMVEGELNIDQYEKDGEKRSFTKIKVDRIEFQKGGGSSNTEKKTNTDTLEFADFQEVNDDEIPF